MSYINIGIIIIIAFIISVVLTKLEIPILRAKAGQNIREDGPQSHLSKAGTPSMGGIAIIISAVAATLIAGLGVAVYQICWLFFSYFWDLDL